MVFRIQNSKFTIYRDPKIEKYTVNYYPIIDNPTEARSLSLEKAEEVPVPQLLET
jgi:hypothetical protein